MEKIIFPLNLRTKRQAVRDLHQALELLGLSVDAKEKENGYLGTKTSKQLRSLQTKHLKHPTDPPLAVTGIVDEATAQLINHLLVERGFLSAETTCQLSGAIRTHDEKPVSGFTVQAFDQDVSQKTLLGTAVTNQLGIYQINFSESSFRKTAAERGGPELFIRVLDAQGHKLAQSATTPNAPQVCTIDLTLPLPPAKIWAISGQVISSDGQPVSEATVKAYDRNIGVDDLLLGHSSTDEYGKYRIEYQPDQLQGKQLADIVLELFSESGEAPIQTVEFCNVGPQLTHDFRLILPAKPVLSEREQITRKIIPLLRGVSRLATLDSKQTTFLGKKTGIEAAKLTRLVQSEQLADEDPTLGCFYYALLAKGESTEADAILRRDRADLVRTIQRAATTHLIPALGQAQLDQILDVTLPKLRGRDLLRNSLGALLDTLPEADQLQDADRLEFATAFGNHGLTQQLWETIKNSPLAVKAPALQRTLALDTVTLNHYPLIAHLQKQHDLAAPDSIAYLARFNQKQWLELAFTYGTPEGSSLAPADYGKTLESAVEQRFPMVAFRERLKQGDITIKDFPAPEVLALLEEHPDFDPAAEHADTFLERVGKKTTRLSVALRKVQRVLPLTTNLRAGAALLNARLDSALAISRAGAGAVIASLAGELSEREARAIHDAATDRTMTNTALVTKYSPLFNRHSIPAIPGNNAATKRSNKYADLRALFGDLDYCACRHCQSVLGPAAYLTDLLHFLETSTPKGSDQEITVQGVPSETFRKSKAFFGLYARRPDIANLLLTCENTHTEIPYIDLVLEVLENAVALPVFAKVDTDKSATIVEVLAAGRVPGEIRDALSATAITIGNDLDVEAIDDPFEKLQLLMARGGGNLIAAASEVPLKLVGIDDGARRWQAGYLPKLLCVSEIDKSSAPGLRDIDFAQSNIDQLEATLHNKQLPKEIEEALLALNLPYKAEITAMTPPDSRELSFALSCQVKVTICFELAFLPRPAADKTATVRYYSITGKKLRDVNIPSPQAVELIQNWLEGQSLTRQELKAVWLLLGIPPLPWEKTYKPSAGKWRLSAAYIHHKFIISDATLAVFTLTYRSSSIQTDLAAVPENRNPAAYDVLRVAHFPWTLPLDLWTEEIRVYLSELGVPRLRMMEMAGVPLSSGLYSCEVLGLSLADVRVLDQYRIESWLKWGLPKTTWLSDLKRVSTILDQSGLSFRELLDLRQTGKDFFGVKDITPECECHPSKMRWEGINKTQLAWIHNFTRLWRKTGWSMRELNNLLAAYGIGKRMPVISLAFAERLRIRLKLPLLHIAAALGHMETVPWTNHLVEGEPVAASLYQQLFQYNALRPSASYASFALNAKKDELQETTKALTAHKHFLAAALGVNEIEVDVLIHKVLVAQESTFGLHREDKLNLANLTLLFGITAYCRSLHLKIAEFQRWLQYLGNPFKANQPLARAQALLDFADQIEFAQKSGSSIDELDYLLRHDLHGEFTDTESRLCIGLTALRDALSKGALLGNISVENLANQLARLGASDMIVTALREESGVASILKAEVQISSPPDPLPILPKEMQQHFYYRQEDAAETVWLGCRGDIKDDDFEQLPADLQESGSELQSRYKCIRSVFTSQLHILCPGDDISALPSFPVLIAKPPILESQIKIPEYLLSFLSIKVVENERKLQLNGLLTDIEGGKLIEIIPDLKKQIEDLLERANKERSRGVDFLKPSIAEELLIHKSNIALHQVLYQLVPILELDLLTSQVASLFSLDTSMARRLLTIITLDKTKGAPQALAILTDRIVLVSDTSKPIVPEQCKNQIQVLFKLDKAAMLLRHAGLAASQLDWIEVFDVLNLNDLSIGKQQRQAFAQWRAFLELARLKDVIAGDARTIQTLAELLQKSSATQVEIEQLFATAYELGLDQVTTAVTQLEFNKQQLHTPANLLRLIELLHLLKLLGATIETIRQLITEDPGSQDGMAARQLFMAQFDTDVLPKRLQPISDKLRVQQRDALVDYLKWRDQLQDENALLDYYLIDVLMEPCMRTSRIKQAISSVQLYIQRCLLNLENQAPCGVAPGDINTTHWRWMKNYRVWEANRKVFLYPENWIEPDLRDDKSEIFRALESDLQQENLNFEAGVDAFLGYLERATDIARLTVVALWEDTYENEKYVVEVLARDTAAQANFYHRQLSKTGDILSWTPWESIEGTIDSEHVFIFKLAGFLHIAYAEITADPPYWKVGMAVRRKNKKGWSAPFKSSGKDLQQAPMVVNKDQGRGFVFELGRREEKGCESVEITGYAVVLGSTYVLAPVEGELIIKSSYSPPLWQTLKATVRVLEKFTDQYGHVMYTEPRGRTSKPWCPEIQLHAEFFHWNGNFTDPGVELPGYPLKRKDTIPHEFKTYGFENLAWILGIDTEAFKWPRIYKLYIEVKGDPTYHQEEKKILEIDVREMGSGIYEHDIIFTVKEEVDYPSPAPERNISFHALETFIVKEDLSIIKNNFLSQASSTIQIGSEDFEYYRSGRQQLRSKAFGPVKPFLVKSNGQYYMPSTQPKSSNADRIEAYADDRFRLYFLSKNSKTLALVEGLDWIYEALKQVRSPTKSNSTGTLLPSEYQPLQNEELAPSPDPLNIPLDTSVDREISDIDLRISFDRNRPPSIYTWEVFFQVPLLIATQLSAAQRFEDAQRWFHTIFDPTRNDEEKDEAKRYWCFPPFQEAGQGESIEHILEQLAQGTYPDLKKLHDLISAWKNDPFKPHLIGRYRIRAYQWTVVIKYIENLLAWGDQLFRRDTIETINEATQLYILAARILGQRPASVPRCQAQPRSYLELAHGMSKGLDDFSNAWKALENCTSGSLSGAGRMVEGNSHFIPHGLYFCIPPNSGIEALWDKVENRLFNIRHCRNIEGIERKLPLFEPPIDPALLVKAAAAGLDISAVLADLAAPLPLYRFNVMLQKAFEVCAELKSLGANLLLSLEKKDAEALALKRSQYELLLLDMSHTIREKQIEEAKANLEGLQESRKTIEQRYGHYQLLLGKSDIAIPQLGTATSMEIVPLNLAKSGLASDTTGLGISQIEADQLSNMNTAQDYTLAAGIGNAAAAVAFAVGSVVPASGVANCVGHSISALANTLSAFSSYISTNATLDEIIGGYQRRRDDWIFQSNLALRELQQIDKQITAAEIRSAIAQSELDNLEKQRDNLRSIDDFMTSRFTNQELYRWMSTQLSSLYFRTYQLAHELSKRAERCFQFELGLSDTSYIKFGYWDSLKKGLLAGEQLYQDLKRLDIAYLEGNKREYEITKHVSLLQLNPFAFIAFRETGRCEFEIPEHVFDMDFAHYMRRIKSASISIPCITGQYSGVFCTLTLLSSIVRKTNIGEYTPPNPEDTEHFIYDYNRIQSIVTSSGQTDSGMFEPNLHDERYLPFEGVGAISTWRLEVSTEWPQFDRQTISDVILHLRYTAREGGGQFRKKVTDYLDSIFQQFSENSPVRFFSVRHEFPTEWSHFLNKKSESNQCELSFDLRPEHFPYIRNNCTINIVELTIFARTSNELTVSAHENDDVDHCLHKICKNSGSFNELIECKFANKEISMPKIGKKFNLLFSDKLLTDLFLAVKWKVAS